MLWWSRYYFCVNTSTFHERTEQSVTISLKYEQMLVYTYCQHHRFCEVHSIYRVEPILSGT